MYCVAHHNRALSLYQSRKPNRDLRQHPLISAIPVVVSHKRAQGGAEHSRASGPVAVPPPAINKGGSIRHGQ